MLKRTILTGLFVAAAVAGAMAVPTTAQAQGGVGQPNDWNRFYYYPYVYYPENFRAPQTYDSLYHRYPQSRQIPVYNKAWHNFYPSPRPYHKGHHFELDVF